MTIEKVKQIASEKYGMEMTDDMAEKYIAKYSDRLGKLTDDELENVGGGCGETPLESCPNCESSNIRSYENHYICNECGHRFNYRFA